MSDGIPDGITRDHILSAIADFDDGVEHEFAESIEYDLVYDGHRYPPKAVVGLAAARLTGDLLGPYDFKGGLESKCIRLLENSGFTIAPKDLVVLNDTPTWICA